MSADSVMAFAADLREFQLLEPAAYQIFLTELLPGFTEARALAGELLQRGWLTPFQVNRLLQGQGRELSLGPYVMLERLGEGGMGQVFKAQHRKLRRLAALKVIHKKSPEDRFRTPGELATVLEQGLGSGQWPEEEKTELTAGLAAPEAREANNRPGSSGGRLWLKIGAGIGAVCLGLAAVIIFLLPGSENGPTPSDAPDLTLQEKVERDLGLLWKQVRKASPDKWRELVFDFCSKYPGTPQAAQAAPLLRKAPPLINSLAMKLQAIPPGKFLMGSPRNEAGRNPDEDQHEVVLTRPFYIGVHEVTVGQFKRFVKEAGYQTHAEQSGQGSVRHFPTGAWKMDAKTSWRNPGFNQADDHPVVCVNWHDAQAFCHWLSEKEKAAYRLPTEAEWEYGCRAGSTTPWYSGNDAVKVKEIANVADFSQKRQLPSWPHGMHPWDDGYPFTAPVGKFQPNAFGLFDMCGNASEWCQDWYGADYYKKCPKQDPPGPETGSKRVLRGGGWHQGIYPCCSSRRNPPARLRHHHRISRGAAEQRPVERIHSAASKVLTTKAAAGSGPAGSIRAIPGRSTPVPGPRRWGYPGCRGFP